MRFSVSVKVSHLVVSLILFPVFLGCDAICNCQEPEPCPEPLICPEQIESVENSEVEEFQFDHSDGYRGFPWGTSLKDIRQFDDDLVGCTDVTPVEEKPTFYVQCKSRTSWDANIRYVFEKANDEFRLVTGLTTLRGTKDEEAEALLWAMFEKYGPLPPAEGEDLRLEWESYKTAIWINDVPGGFSVGYMDKRFLRTTMGQEETKAKHPELSRKMAMELRL